MKNILSPKTALVALMTLSASVATAGYRYGSEVQIDRVRMVAKGTMANARASADSNQMIGCVVRAGWGPTASANCMATDSTGYRVECSTTDSSFVQAIGSITPHSNLYFTWDSGGTCKQLSIENYSSNAPIAP